jgi:hypothetical protein
MSRDGSGTYSLPANTLAVSGDAISSTKFNSLVQDLEADANVDRPIAAGGTGASTASAARTNLGLEIGVNIQAYDAGLASIAGLTTLADRSIYTTASDTYAVYTLTAAGRAILDDADASAQRTTLGLGTAATVNTGTSGATIPLLNGVNTFGAAQTFGADIVWSGNIAGASTTFAGTFGANPTGSILTGGYVQVWASGSANPGRTAIGNASQTLLLDGASGFTYNSNTIWHAGNDGAGSTLDADTVDGLQASSLVQTTGTQSVGGVKTFTSQVAITYSGSPELSVTDSTGGANGVFRAVAGTSLTFGSTNNVPIIVIANNAEVARFINGGGFVARAAASTETTGTLTVASANRTIQATGDITIPNAVFSAGDIILIYAGASSRTITEGASVTMRLGGTATTGSRTLAARGVAVLFFVSSSEVVVSGGAVT